MYIASIKRRHSVRTFQKERLTAEQISQISLILNKTIKTPNGTKNRFKLLLEHGYSNELLKGLHTYGVIKNASAFIVGLISKNDGDLVDFGFALEQIILELTNIGIGSCWLGGTFLKSSFFRRSDGQDGEIIPCIIAIGIENPRMSLTDKVIRTMAKSHKRKAMNDILVNCSRNNLLSIIDHQHLIALEMLRLSPSASNKQPWKIVINNNMFEFYLKRNNSYNKMINYLKLSDLQMVDIGIAMSHFELALADQGIQGKWINLDSKTCPYQYISTFCIEGDGVE